MITLYGFDNVISKLEVCFAIQFITKWSSAKGSSPIPFKSYSNTSLVKWFVSINLALAYIIHSG